MLSQVVLCVLLAFATNQASAETHYAIAIKYRSLANPFVVNEANTAFFAKSGSAETSLSRCAEFASSRQVNRFVIGFTENRMSRVGGSVCRVYNATEGQNASVGVQRHVSALCSQQTCTSAADFEVYNGRDDLLSQHWAIWIQENDFTQCLRHFAQLNRRRSPEELYRNIQLRHAANGHSLCGVLFPVMNPEQTFNIYDYSGKMSSDDSPQMYGNLSCSSPFVNASEINDCVAFQWQGPDVLEPDVVESLWERFNRWWLSPKRQAPEHPPTIRPSMPIVAGRPHPGSSLAYKVLDASFCSRLNIAAFNDNVRIIQGSTYIPQHTFKALNATEAIQKCAAIAQNKFYRSFSLVQRYNDWECSVIWEELKDVRTLMTKDDNVIRSFVYSASLNSTLH